MPMHLYFLSLKLLQNYLPGGVIAEIVGFEYFTGEERLQVLDVDLLGLGHQVSLANLHHLLLHINLKKPFIASFFSISSLKKSI